ncbi:MAG: hypothetical protein NTV38_13055 [Chloroflexi bacterium]|nr:hypothetical protein [Chloroflexota bacterium]
MCKRCGADYCNDPDSKACSDNCIMRHQKEIEKLREVIRQTRKSLWREQMDNNPFDKDEDMPPEWNELTEKLIQDCCE